MKYNTNRAWVLITGLGVGCCSGLLIQTTFAPVVAGWKGFNRVTGTVGLFGLGIATSHYTTKATIETIEEIL